MEKAALSAAALVSRASAFVALALLACPPAGAGQKGKEEAPKAVDWGKEENGVRCALIAPAGKQPSPLGEPISLVVLTKNFGENGVHLAEGPPFAVFRMRVVGPDGKAPPLSVDGRRQHMISEEVGITTALMLAPGTERQTKLHLSYLFDMSRQGEYKIQVERLFYRPDNSEAIAKSNLLTITVGEPKPKQKER